MILSVFIIVALAAQYTTAIDSIKHDTAKFGYNSDARLLCPPGWWMVYGRCSDIDECIGHSLHRACPGENTLCRNTLGSFRCECARNHVGDAYSYHGCSPVNCSALTVQPSTTAVTTPSLTTTDTSTTNSTIISTTISTTNSTTNSTTISTTISTTNSTTLSTTMATTMATTISTTADVNSSTMADSSTNVTTTIATTTTTTTNSTDMTSPATTVNTFNLEAVPDGYTRCAHPEISDGSFFRLHMGTPVTWQQAADQCNRDNALSRLAKISNSRYALCLSRMLLFASFNSPAWIGLRFDQQAFRWTDGEEVTFDMWAENEPSSSRPGSCVTMRVQGALWRTQPCDQTASSFFCEFPVTANNNNSRA